jgi:hypothetical protein
MLQPLRISFTMLPVEILQVRCFDQFAHKRQFGEEHPIGGYVGAVSDACVEYLAAKQTKHRETSVSLTGHGSESGAWPILVKYKPGVSQPDDLSGLIDILWGWICQDRGSITLEGIQTDLEKAGAANIVVRLPFQESTPSLFEREVEVVSRS